MFEEFNRRRRMAELVRYTGTFATPSPPTPRSKRSTRVASEDSMAVLVDSSMWVHQKLAHLVGVADFAHGFQFCRSVISGR